MFKHKRLVTALAYYRGSEYGYCILLQSIITTFSHWLLQMSSVCNSEFLYHAGKKVKANYFYHGANYFYIKEQHIKKYCALFAQIQQNYFLLFLKGSRCSQSPFNDLRKEVKETEKMLKNENLNIFFQKFKPVRHHSMININKTLQAI